MRIVSRKALIQAWKKHPDAEQRLRAWMHEVKKVTWRRFADVRAMYRSADSVGDRVVFNVGGNNYRLIVRVKYVTKVVFVRWFGTHAEYDRLKDVSKV